MKKTYRSILSIGLLAVLIVSLVFMLTGCGFLTSSPTAKIDGPEGTVSVNEEVTFDGGDSEPSDSEGEITDYDWTFPDEFDLGSDPDQKVQTGSFTESGDYEVELKVTDDDGKEDTTSVDVEVS